jgi:hypothetical protein
MNLQAFALGVIICQLAAGVGVAQSRARVFDAQLGTHFSMLPSDEWVEPACGTNGGPPSLQLDGFENFGSCRVDDETGLWEVSFIYDDEWEYLARALGTPEDIRRYSASYFYAQPILTSLMFDAGGFLQGYRVITDPRTLVETRQEAYGLHLIFKTLFENVNWDCTNLPAQDREIPFNGVFIKSSCIAVNDTLFVRSEARFLSKPGQNLRDVPGLTREEEGNFESWSRLDVYALNAVTGAPCCNATHPGGESPPR